MNGFDSVRKTRLCSLGLGVQLDPSLLVGKTISPPWPLQKIRGMPPFFHRGQHTQLLLNMWKSTLFVWQRWTWPSDESSLFQALSQWVRSKKRARDERDPVRKNRRGRPLLFFFHQIPLVPRPVFDCTHWPRAWNRLCRKLFRVFYIWTFLALKRE